MKITIETGSYNERRMGKPYIARVTFADAKGNPEWGTWVGNPGTAGVLVIEANPGDIIMTGQKDNRQPRNNTPEYFSVEADGTLNPLKTKADAYKHFTAGPAIAAPATTLHEESVANGYVFDEKSLAGFTDAEIIAELRRRGLSL